MLIYATIQTEGVKQGTPEVDTLRWCGGSYVKFWSFLTGFTDSEEVE